MSENLKNVNPQYQKFTLGNSLEYKEQVIYFLKRVFTVSVGTMKIVREWMIATSKITMLIILLVQ